MKCTAKKHRKFEKVDFNGHCHMGANKESFHSIELANGPTGTIGNGSKWDLNCITEMNDVGRMAFNEDDIANSFGVNNLIKRGFHAHMDSTEEICVFVKKDNVVKKSSQLMTVHIFATCGMMICALKMK